MRKVELVTNKELNDVNEIYKNARKLMKNTNNPLQWGDFHPPVSLIKKFIKNNELYKLVNENNEILGVFAFIIGEDETYKIIEGNWKNDSKYGTLHSVASSLKEKDVFKDICDFAKSKTNHLRIDTHEDNKIMQKQILKNDFTYQGIIYIASGDSRLAYEWIKEDC